MRIFLTGATGFIGRALVLRLRRDGHEIVAWVRSESGRALLGAEVELVPVSAGDVELTRALERSDAIVNLAGSPVIGRWTATTRRAVVTSRVDLTERLIRALAAASRRPRVMVSGSAIGYYGDRGDEVLTEESPPGAGFLASLTARWEAAARRAEPLGLRVVTIRTGVVLGREGGILDRLLPIFRLGLGGPIGSGKQIVSWIHLNDVVSAITAALEDERYTGPINLTAPDPVTNGELASALGRALGRPARLRVPGAVVRLALGEAASAVLTGQHVTPARLVSLGYRHEFPRLEEALADIVAPRAEIVGLAGGTIRPSAVGSSYLAEHRPKFVLESTTVLDAPPEEAFAFFSHPDNLGLVTPSKLALELRGAPPAMSAGASMDVRLRVGGLPLSWSTRIEDWQPGRRFIDVQLRGPYRAWWHEHIFRPEGGRTVMEDRVFYSLPLGILGRLVHRLFVAPSLRRIFGFRRDAVRLRFGGVTP